MKIEAVVGRWITQYRESAGLTQAYVGEQLGVYLGKPWSRQAVSAAEKGRRAFTASELVAIALVLGCSVEALLQPPLEVSSVVLAEGKPLDARHLRATDAGATGDQSLAGLVQLMASIRSEFPGIAQGVRRVDELLNAASVELWAAVRNRGFEPDPALLGDDEGKQES